MRFDALSLLADENIHADVVEYLRTQNVDVFDVCEEGLQGTSDIDLLRMATNQGRVVLTHDSDFGTLAIAAGEPLVGIVYLRPGHFNPSFTIGTIDAVIQEDLDLVPPFIIVARRRGPHVSIRLRSL